MLKLRGNITLVVIAAFVSFTFLSAVGMNFSVVRNFSSVHDEKKSDSEQTTSAISYHSLSVDTPPPPDNGVDLHYPIYDRLTDFLTTPAVNSFDLQDPSNINKSVEYDPQTGQYVINETIGDQFYRNPTYMSFEDFLNYEYKQQEGDYWQQRSNAATLLSQRSIVPDVNVNNRIFDRIFGGTKVDIRPQGNIDLTFGGNYQRILNPTLTTRQQKQGGFNFDMNIQMSVLAKIGDKLRLNVNYNTQSNFSFENQVKLEYTGYQEDIIKKIEAGNISFPLKGSLITGNQSLFGLKTQLQFGRLTVTAVISQQQSQTQNVTIQGGAQQQSYRITCDQYDENRNYYMAQYFRDHYNEALSQIPIVNSQVNITKIEVWVTNKTGATQNVRDIVTFQDLGEASPYRTDLVQANPSNVYPYGYAQLTPGVDLNSNNLYTQLTDPTSQLYPARYSVKSMQVLTNNKFVPVQDFEKIYARRLAPNEYTFDPRVGYLLLNQQLNPDDVLSVAYQYTVNGQLYQVGEFAADVPPSGDSSKVLFQKMLKSTSAQTALPLWKLQMQNVYSLGAYQINPDDFFFDIYYLDPAGGEKRYIPADNLNGTPLISVLGLDRLNNNNDPQPDGVFDFIPNITIIPANGKVIFPVVEPFGKDLSDKFSNPLVATQYVYQQLYDSTKTVAEQFPQYNRYLLKGTYKSSVSSEISLGAFNVPPGSVSVTAGGQKLTENVDYTVDYNLGRVKILNQGLLNSGVPINVSYENNALFSFQTRTLFGTRLDYYINDHFTLGGTFMKLWERPYTTKLNAGYDPINNAMLGVDGSYSTDAPIITKMVDALPLFSTKEKSNITLSGEAARLQPGHSNAIGKQGTVYIDDFEGTQTTYDLRFPFISWKLAATPQGVLFPESTLIDTLPYGFNRAKLSWYNIDPFFWLNSAPAGIKNNPLQTNNFYSRQVNQLEIFPNTDFTNNPFDQRENTFDLRYEPRKRGAYNFTTENLQLQPDGSIGFDSTDLQTLRGNWAGITRSIDQTDFEQANIEYIQFWVLDPFLYNEQMKHSGTLYFDMGNISEDVLKDSKFFYENGLSPTGDTSIENRSNWGFSPQVPPITNAFDNDPNSRQWQDVGYDGLRDAADPATDPQASDEVRLDHVYLNQLTANYPPEFYNAAVNDPANDDYRYFDDDYYNNNQTGILDRYERYNNPEGNAPISNSSQTVSSAATNQPESEDLNNDNTIVENESYFHYKVNISPEALSTVGTNFITDQIYTDVPPIDNYTPGVERWIQIKIPISDFEQRIGNIPDFKSIRFVRMYMTGFDTTVILRFARMELVRNQWRKYLYSLESPGESNPDDNGGTTFFNVSSVSIEENGSRVPVNYVIPPGIQREQIVGQIGTQYQNESSLSVQVCNLQNGDARAVFKNINLDLRQYDDLKMFIHAEGVVGQPQLNTGDLTGFIRLGSDFTNNYYEYEIPLIPTPLNDPATGTNDPNLIWPAGNEMDITLRDLVDLKEVRNLSGYPPNQPYTVPLSNGATVTIIGNPNLGLVITAMLGVRNPKNSPVDADDGLSKCAEIWYDELRLEGFDENAGNAAIARADIKLADLGNLALSTTMHGIGFGQIEQKLNERYKDNFFSYDAATTLALGKFFPTKIGLQLPLYLGISKQISTPQYDPYDLDILLKDKLSLIDNPQERNDAKQAAQTYVSISSINLSNVRIQPNNKGAKVQIYSPQNLNLTYAYTRSFGHTPIISQNTLKNQHLELGYAFPGKSKFLSPFDNLISAKAKYLKIIRDINFNYLPTNLSYRTAMDRQFGELYLRPLAPDEIIIPTYNKYWTWDRAGGFRFDISKGLSLDFNALAHARIDEPDGRINTPEKKDSVWNNIKHFGRTTNYTQAGNVNYTLPINKIPILDWTQTTFRYGSNYTWITAPLVVDTPTQTLVPSPLGNTITNTQNIAFNGDLNFRNLYNKSKFLKRYDTNAPPPKKKNNKANADSTSASQQNTSKTKNSDTKTPTIGAERVILRLPLMLKRVTLNYTEAHGTVVPGYLPKPKFVGQDFSIHAPGFGFTFGYQPDSNWLNNAAKKGWMSTDPNLNYLFVQTSQKQFSMKGTLEPFRDFLIEINFNKTLSENLSEYFKVANPVDGFQHLNRTQYGTMTMSYIPIKTSFVPIKPNQFSKTFLQFQDYRQTISARLTALNPASNFEPFPIDVSSGAYYKGYGPYSQDVLVPAFLAAYIGSDPNTISLYSPFTKFPLPNWRITYNGITKMPWAKKIWNSVNLTHGYTSTLAFASFTSALNFQGPNPNLPSNIDATSNNFISYYYLPGIIITEQFNPLIGIDMTWKNSLSTKIEYRRARNLAFSFLDYQLTESRTEDITLGVGYKFRNVPIPFKVKGKKKTLKNDLNFQLNVTLSDNTVYSQKLDQAVASQPTSGVETIEFSPAVDYTINNRLNVRVFFDKRITNPKISSSYPIRYTDGGVTLRFSLGQ